MPTTPQQPERAGTGGHTAGPWTFYGDTMIAKNGELIAEVLRGGNRQLPIQSNRRLIAAAPDLLAALESFVHRWGNWPKKPTGADLEIYLDEARAAIARATSP